VLLLPRGTRSRGVADALPADAGLEAVGQRAVLQQPGRAQPRDQVVGAAVGQRAAQEREDAAAQRRVAGGDDPRQGDRQLVGAKHRVQQRRRLAQPAVGDRDLLRRGPLPHQPRDVRGDQLRLGPLAPALQQRDRGACPFFRTTARPGVEVALDRRERRAGGGRVVVVARLAGDLAGEAERGELLVGRRAGGGGVTAGLVGQREPDVRAAAVGQRVDCRQLGRREVVEPVEEHRRGSPALGLQAQALDRGARGQRGVGAPVALQLAAVGREQRGHLLAVLQRAGIPAGGGADGRVEAAGLDAQLPELVDQPHERRDEARRRGRRPQARELDGGDGGRREALAHEIGDRPRPAAGAAAHLLHEPLEPHDAGAEHGAGGGQLAAVPRHVGEGRDDEQRLAVEQLAVAIEDDPGLGGVGGTGDERQGHDLPGSQAGPTA
jgi:hypothetical protein